MKDFHDSVEALLMIRQVTMRWKVVLHPQEVIGVTALETEKAPKGSQNDWLISGVFSEFNAGAWLVDLGVYVPTCGLGPIAS